MSDKKKPMSSKKQKKYKTVIIGAGRIASGYDKPHTKQILTHAHALTDNVRVELVGISDIDATRGKKEAHKWGVAYFNDHKSMLSILKPEIVVIATPDDTHKKILLDVFAYNPKVIVVEKPVVNEKRDIEAVRRAAKKTGIPVVVNFRRRFDVTVNEVRDALIKGRYGSVLSASGIYSKGILHNGSHMIDLARYLFGEVTNSKMHFNVDDFPEGEPSIGGVVTFERCPQFYLMTGDERSFYVFEFEIVTEKRRIRFIDEGRRVVIQEVVADTVYPEDRVLGESKIKKTQLADSMTAMVEHVIRVADGKESPHSSLEEALRTQETCYRLLSSLKK